MKHPVLKVIMSLHLVSGTVCRYTVVNSYLFHYVSPPAVQEAERSHQGAVSRAVEAPAQEGRGGMS